MEEITKNPGFQHLSEDISKLLDNQSLMNCRLVNSSWKKILDKPKFLLKKFNSEEKLWRIPNDVQRSWKMLAYELNDTDDDFNPKFKDENKLKGWEILAQELIGNDHVSREFVLILMKMYQILGFQPPLEIVIKLGNAKKFTKLIRFILEHVDIHSNVTINLENAKRFTTLIKFILEHENINSNIRISLDPNRDATCIPGATPIHLAAYYGLPGTIKKLLKKYDSPDIKTTFGGTPLYCGAFNGQLEIVKLLTGLTFTPNSPDNHGRTPLNQAVLLGYSEIVKFMVSKVEFLENQPDPINLIKEAISINHIEIVKILISKLENPFAPDQSGNTIIHTAIDVGLKWGSMEIFKFLASMVEDPNAPNVNGDTPLKKAFRNKDRKMFEIIFAIVNKSSSHIQMQEDINQHQKMSTPPQQPNYNDLIMNLDYFGRMILWILFIFLIILIYLSLIIYVLYHYYFKKMIF